MTTQKHIEMFYSFSHIAIQHIAKLDTIPNTITFIDENNINWYCRKHIINNITEYNVRGFSNENNSYGEIFIYLLDELEQINYPISTFVYIIGNYLCKLDIVENW
jgi:hypothetical protein